VQLDSSRKDSDAVIRWAICLLCYKEYLQLVTALQEGQVIWWSARTSRA
jgi:hypothetical protein